MAAAHQLSLMDCMVSQRKKEQPLIGVVIIGTADPQIQQMTAMLYQQMLQTASTWVAQLGIAKTKIRLISGGAALSDHLAVDLFLQSEAKEVPESDRYAGLTLFLPCRFDLEKQQYEDNGLRGYRTWQKNPGQLANVYHRRFSQMLGGCRNTLQEISMVATAHADKAKLDSTKFGFHARNSAVAGMADYMLAFTWQVTKEPVEGGTSDTWKKAAARARKREHICLWDLLPEKKKNKRDRSPPPPSTKTAEGQKLKKSKIVE